MFITATITALVVVTVGTLPFLGLVIPNIISIYRGYYLKNAIPHTMMLGAIFVLFSDSWNWSCSLLKLYWFNNRCIWSRFLISQEVGNETNKKNKKIMVEFESRS